MINIKKNDNRSQKKFNKYESEANIIFDNYLKDK